MQFYTESGQVATDTVVMTAIGGSRRRVASSSARAEEMDLDTKPRHANISFRECHQQWVCIYLRNIMSNQIVSGMR